MNISLQIVDDWSFEIISAFDLISKQQYYYAKFNPFFDLETSENIINSLLDWESSKEINCFRVEENEEGSTIKVFSTFTVCWKLFKEFLACIEATYYQPMRDLKEQNECENSIPDYVECQEDYESHLTFAECLISDDFNQIGYEIISYDNYISKYE
ncbi:hypothetical protein [Iningainema tapete]|uniref:Uncharacterized protein n=1 Tax=Iningainema tapete BLCC-T55 TaxID=2748662 RepID=A0A8J6XFJ6_9CYAN|nr:hypothetical protein [Iningainema tapete]MBD2774819.1 hypothetical protein [Iningainema tapete BLCC-T55]